MYKQFPPSDRLLELDSCENALYSSALDFFLRLSNLDMRELTWLGHYASSFAELPKWNTSIDFFQHLH